LADAAHGVTGAASGNALEGVTNEAAGPDWSDRGKQGVLDNPVGVVREFVDRAGFAAVEAPTSLVGAGGERSVEERVAELRQVMVRVVVDHLDFLVVAFAALGLSMRVRNRVGMRDGGPEVAVAFHRCCCPRCSRLLPSVVGQSCLPLGLGAKLGWCCRSEVCADIAIRIG